MFESKSGENSSFMLENVTSNILHCPCPQVKTCEPTSKYMYHHKILAGREKHEPWWLPGELHGGGGGDGVGREHARPLRERDDRAGFSRSWTVQVSFLLPARGQEMHKNPGLLSLNVTACQVNPRYLSSLFHNNTKADHYIKVGIKGPLKWCLNTFLLFSWYQPINSY